MDCTHVKGDYCGCPSDGDDCAAVCMPGIIETKMVNMPQACIKPPCNYAIPAVPCRDAPNSRRPLPNALCFDWTVDEPGPNDSYGLNGLNWYDFSMEYHNRAMDFPGRVDSTYVPAHPGFSKKLPPFETEVFQVNRPIECYSRFPGPCKGSGFRLDVNYFRDWRCCTETNLHPPWKPPMATWATNQAL